MNDRAQAEWAQQCASIIVESGITDWQIARRKAARQVNLPPNVREPSDAQIVSAIAQYHALYQPEEHAAQLTAQREEALSWMEFFTDYSPRLTGPVAEGWAHELSEIRIELNAPDEKLFEILLVNEGIAYTVDEGANRAVHYVIDDADWPLRLMLLSDATRGRARWNPQSPRISIVQLQAMLATKPL